MTATITAWLASQGASLLLGFLAQVISQALQTWQQNRDQAQLGQLTSERDQALAANKAKDAELQAQADAPADIEAAARRLDEGSA